MKRRLLVIVGAVSMFAVAPASMPQAIGATAGAASTVRVPFVACNSDGQLGPRHGPQDKGQSPSLPRAIGRNLAFYVSTDLGVLAPRGWHCFGLYGSSGVTLIVTPEPHGASDFLKSPAARLNGPAVVLSFSYGDTSGRFDVAQVAARLFPAKKSFVQQIVREGIEPAGSFPFGPYPHDVLTRKSATDVEFETPGRADGMGTRGLLVKTSSPIRGLAIITSRNDLILLDVRLPPNLGSVAAGIIEQAARSSGVRP